MRKGETGVQAKARVQVFLEAYRECGSVKLAAEQAGVSHQQHYARLKRDAKYREAFDAVRKAIEEQDKHAQEERDARIRESRIALKEHRLSVLQERWHRLQIGLVTILRERSVDMDSIPGGSSGLLVRDFRGKDSMAEIYRIDPGIISLIMELRNHERQAAQELGQLVQKTEMTGPDGTPLTPTIEIVLVDPSNQ